MEEIIGDEDGNEVSSEFLDNFLTLLEVILAQDSSYSFRFKLKIPRSRRSSPSVKESMGGHHIYIIKIHIVSNFMSLSFYGI